MKFKGWDWTELFRLWPYSKKIKWPEATDENPFADEEAMAAWLRDQLFILAWPSGKKSKVTQRKIDNVRAFVEKVASINNHACTPLFVGLCNIKDDETFLRYTAILLEHLWT